MNKSSLLAINKAVLFACVSIYLGTGLSLVLFSFPTAPQLTTENYYLQFVPQVEAATRFFTWMTMLMMFCCMVFIIEKWRSPEKWFPIAILSLIIVATLITTQLIFPYNERMASGIQDQAELQEVLRKWMNLSILRGLVWAVQWLLMMAYFFIHELRYSNLRASKPEFA